MLAVDVPTGLDADTGVAPAGILRADRTVTFAAAKPGHFIGDGPDRGGGVDRGRHRAPGDGVDVGRRGADVARGFHGVSAAPTSGGTQSGWSPAVPA